MSRTIKDKEEFTKHAPKGRANELGLCRYTHCKNARYKNNREIIKAKHKARTQ